MSSKANAALVAQFAYEHLPANEQTICRPYGELARAIDKLHKNNPEKEAALKGLLISRTCALNSHNFTEAHRRGKKGGVDISVGRFEEPATAPGTEATDNQNLPVSRRRSKNQ